MSEKLGNSSFEEFDSSEESSVSSLEEMADQFDPDKAEAEKQKETEKVLFEGEVSKLTENAEGKAKLESEYMDAWSKYKEGENYNENDKELNQAIQDVGFSAALLDVNKDVVDSLQNGNGDLFEVMKKDTRILHIFDKACEDAEKIANSGNGSAAKETMDFIKDTGKVGDFIVGRYKSWQEGKVA